MRARLISLFAAVVLCAGAAAAGRLPIPAVVRYFPGDYFDQTGQRVLSRVVLVRWPGVPGLAARYRSGKLPPERRVGILLGGASFHDPRLLPIYIEGLADADARVRQAAAYGFQTLLGEDPPDVRRGIDEAEAAALADKVKRMAGILRVQPLVDYWLGQLASSEKPVGTLSARGRAERLRGRSLRALDRILMPEDLPEVLAAYQGAGSEEQKMMLLPLIESLTCRRFVFKPTNPRKGWGPAVYRLAVEDVDRWLAPRTDLSAGAVLQDSLAGFGMRGIDPLGPEACGVWLEVLRRGESVQWPMAGRQLYRCGGPPVKISILRPGLKRAKTRRRSLLRWYGFDNRGRRRTAKGPRHAGP